MAAPDDAAGLGGAFSPASRFELLPRNAEDVTRSLTAIAIASYVIGLLVVNVYLYRLGVSEFSLLRARFVITGVLALIPIWACLISLTALPLLLDIRSARRYDRRAPHLLLNIVRLVGPVALLFILGKAAGIHDRVLVGPFGLSLGLTFVWILGLGVAGAILALPIAAEGVAGDAPDRAARSPDRPYREQATGQPDELDHDRPQKSRRWSRERSIRAAAPGNASIGRA